MSYKIGWLALVFLLVLGCPAEAREERLSEVRQAGDTGRLLVERSRVNWQSPGMAEPEQVDTASQMVSAGDLMSTDGLGRARLTLAADAVATIYHDTALTLLDAPSRHLNLNEGTLFIQSEGSGTPVVIETAEGRVEATGRVLVHRLMDHRRNRSRTWVLVQSGQARVDGGGSQVTLDAKQQTWIENGGRPEKPLEARRDLVDTQFYLIDDLTNGAIMDEDLLSTGPAVQPSSFPWALVLTLGAAVMVGALILVAMRSRPRTAPGALPAQPGHAPASLVVVSGDGDGRQIPIHGSLSIGRAPDNQLPIADPQVSSHHARIVVQGGDYILEDLQSKNGTFVNEQRMTAHRLQSGDQVRIGQLTFVFQSAATPQLERSTSQPAPTARPSAGVRMAHGEFIAMSGPTLTIGRAPDNQVVLSDQQASAHHARLVAETSGVAIEDLGSTNGTFVNDRQVNRQQLAHDDRIRVGQTEMSFQVVSSQEGRS